MTVVHLDRAFDPNEPRNPHGEWTDSGGSAGGATAGDQEPPERVFHGTTSEYIDSIRSDGLVVAIGSGRAYLPSLYRGARGESVFVTQTAEGAQHWAKQAVLRNGGRAVILEFAVPMSALNIDSEGGSGSWYVKGGIPAKYLRRYGMLDSASNQWRWTNTKSASDMVVYAAVVVDEEQKAKAFDPNEPRDDHGQWTSGGGGAAGAMSSSDFVSVGGHYSNAEESMHEMNRYIGSGSEDYFVSEEEASSAKAAVQEQLSDGLKGNADWQSYLRLTHSTLEVGDEEASHLVSQWAKTSSDTSEESLLLQATVAEEFGLEGHRNAGLNAGDVGYVDPKDLNSLADSVVRWRTNAPDAGFPNAKPVSVEDRETVKNGYRAFVREMYTQTQADLAKNGITSVYLARGVGETLPWGVNDLRLHPMSSFSADVEKAYNFTGASMIIAKVPASRILSTPRTGFGCLDEKEAVVLGPGLKAVVLPRTTLAEMRTDWSTSVASALRDEARPKKALTGDGKIEVDGTLENADWTKTTWDLPPYKSPEFMALVNDLDAFKKLPVYLHAVRTGVIVNDEWVGPKAKHVVYLETKFNPYHRPGGPGGGQFTGPDEGGEGAGPTAGPKVATGRQTHGILEPVPERVVANMEAALAKEGLTPEFMNSQVDHYMKYAQAHPEVWTEGMGWDEREHELAMSIAASSNSGLTTDGAAAVLAADSPRTSVQTARDNAAATVAVANADGKLEVTAEMVEARYRAALAAAKKEPAGKQPALRDLARVQKAYALKNDLGSHDVLTGDAAIVSRWSESRTILPDNWEKGLRIARGEAPAGVLSGAKVWSFYDNMRNPTESKSVTIDTWMLRGMSGKLTAKGEELQKLLGSTKGQKSNGRYEVFSRRIYDGAVRYHTTPLQTQAIIWTAIQHEMAAARIKPK